MPPPDRAEKEYADVSQNMRHYSNMRFAQMTLFAAITAGLVKVATEVGTQWPRPAQVLVCVAGLVVAGCFWVMEERAADYWHHFRRRAEQLEAYLTLSQYAGTKRARISATNAVRVLYLLAVLAWCASVVMLLAEPHSP